MPPRIEAKMREGILQMLPAPEPELMRQKIAIVISTFASRGITIRENFCYSLIRKPHVHKPPRCARMRTVIVDENVERVYYEHQRNHGRISVRGIASCLDLSPSTVYKILTEELDYYAY